MPSCDEGRNLSPNRAKPACWRAESAVEGAALAPCTVLLLASASMRPTTSKGTGLPSARISAALETTVEIIARATPSSSRHNMCFAVNAASPALVPIETAAAPLPSADAVATGSAGNAIFLTRAWPSATQKKWGHVTHARPARDEPGESANG